MNDIRKRLNKFVETNDQQATENSEDAGSEALREQKAFYETFVRENRGDHNKVWSWHASSTVFEVSEPMLHGDVHWHYYLRNALVSDLAADSLEWRRYCGYLKSLDLHCEESKLPVIKRKLLEIDREIERVAAEKEAKARQEEEEKAKKGAKPKADTKKPDPKKGTDKKKGIEEAVKPFEEPQPKLEVSQVVSKEVKGRKRPHKPHESDQWRLFEIANKQLSLLPLDAITPAAYLEAFCHEIETRLEGDVQPHLEAEEKEQEGEMKEFLDIVLDGILESK